MPYMSNEQAKAYNKVVDDAVLKLNISEFSDVSNRTLVIGIQEICHDRAVHVHVYIKDNELHIAYYEEPSNQSTIHVSDHTSGKEFPVTDLSPMDKCFPWSTDIEFAELMLAKNAPLPVMDCTYSKPPRMSGGYLGGVKVSWN